MYTPEAILVQQELQQRKQQSCNRACNRARNRACNSASTRASNSACNSACSSACVYTHTRDYFGALCLILLQREIARLDELRLDALLVGADAAAHKPAERNGVYELLRRRIDNFVIQVLARGLRF